MKDINETLEIEPVAWKLDLHFEGRGAESSLEIFLDATKLMKKIAAMGTVTRCVISGSLLSMDENHVLMVAEVFRRDQALARKPGTWTT